MAPAATAHVHQSERNTAGGLGAGASASAPGPGSCNGCLAASRRAAQEDCVCSLQELSSAPNSPLLLLSAVRAEFVTAANTLINVCSNCQFMVPQLYWTERQIFYSPRGRRQENQTSFGFLLSWALFPQ